MIEALTGLFSPGNDAVVWWVTIELIGIVAFPIGFLFFRFLPDRGYSFSKILGLVLVTYLLWLSASAHVLPNQRWSILLILGILAVLSLGLVALHRRTMMRFLQDRWSHLLVIEAFFTAAFFVGVFLRSYFPEIANFDKPIDAAFINGVIRSDYFPARDPWLSGFGNPYYYFTHIVIATQTKLTGIPSWITFNLGGVTLLVLAATAAFGVAYNLVALAGRARRALVTGAVAGIFLLVLSNLIGVFHLLAANSVGSASFYRALDVFGLDGPTNSERWYPTDAWWILNASNFAYGGPDRQFPFFNFLRGDIHGIIGLPFFVMAIGAIVNVWVSGESLSARFLINHRSLSILLALSIGVLGFANVWDLPTILFLLAIMVVIRNYIVIGRITPALARDSLTFLVPIGIASVLLFLPFYLTFSPASSGIELVEVVHRITLVTPEAVITRPHHLLYAWLPFLWLIGSLGLMVIRRHRWSSTQAIMAVAIGSIPLLLWIIGIVVRRGPGGFVDEAVARGSNWITLAILMSLLIALLLGLSREIVKARQDGQRYASLAGLVIAATGVLVLLGMELFFVRDEHFGFRLNTVWRLGYHAWVLLSISGAYAIYYVTQHWRPHRIAASVGRIGWASITLVVILAALAYVPPSLFWRTGDFDKPRTLNGMVLIERFGRPEYEGILWLWENVEGSPVILEASGAQYSTLSRISSLTGLPTVLGWPQQEFAWRGSYEPQAGRKEAIDLAYTTADPAEAKAILERFDVEYVFIGGHELKYGEAGLAKWSTFMEKVFQSEQAIIYRMPTDGESR